MNLMNDSEKIIFPDTYTKYRTVSMVCYLACFPSLCYSLKNLNLCTFVLGNP